MLIRSGDRLLTAKEETGDRPLTPNRTQYTSTVLQEMKNFM
ncbi:hypothetical protein [Laspinema olomoucense]|nr:MULTISPECIES: hypothetical protein [unclassified Laspinema]